MKYGVIWDEGKGVQVGLFNNVDSALHFAAAKQASGVDVQLLEPVQGKIVLTAQIVPDDAAVPSGLNVTAPALSNGHSKPSKPSKSKGSKRTAAELNKLRTRIVSWIQTNPGSGVEEMSKSLGLHARDVALPMKQLLKEKAIKKRGKARATKYYPADAAA